MLALRHRDQLVFGVVCLVALVSLTIYSARTGHWGSDSIDLQRDPARTLDYQIELNEASWVQWSQLPNIGPVLGRRIVEEREQNGPFRSPADLMRVKGIGEKRLREIRPFVRT